MDDKKPVRLPVVDLSSHQARRPICVREVELNGAWRPTCILGVLDVVDGVGTPNEVARAVAASHGRALRGDEVPREGRLHAVESR